MNLMWIFPHFQFSFMTKVTVTVTFFTFFLFRNIQPTLLSCLLQNRGTFYFLNQTCDSYVHKSNKGVQGELRLPVMNTNCQYSQRCRSEEWKDSAKENIFYLNSTFFKSLLKGKQEGYEMT